MYAAADSCVAHSNTLKRMLIRDTGPRTPNTEFHQIRIKTIHTIQCGGQKHLIPHRQPASQPNTSHAGHSTASKPVLQRPSTRHIQPQMKRAYSYGTSWPDCRRQTKLAVSKGSRKDIAGGGGGCVASIDRPSPETAMPIRATML